jgi:hypothetical protein
MNKLSDACLQELADSCVKTARFSMFGNTGFHTQLVETVEGAAVLITNDLMGEQGDKSLQDSWTTEILRKHQAIM